MIIEEGRLQPMQNIQFNLRQKNSQSRQNVTSSKSEKSNTSPPKNPPPIPPLPQHAFIVTHILVRQKRKPSLIVPLKT